MPQSTPPATWPVHLLELTNDVVWMANRDDQQLLYANPAMEQVYGRPLADFYGDPDLWLELVHPADRPLAEQSSRELLAHGQSDATYRIVRPDGTVRWLLDRKYIIAGEGGQPQYIGGIAADITAQKQTELALREKEEQLREVLENSLDASYKRNLQGDTYDYLSPVFGRVTGYTPAEMKAFSLEEVLDLIHPDDQAEIGRVLAMSTAGPPGTAYQVEYRFRHKDGHYRWLHDQFIVVRDEEDRPVAWIGSVSDITERKQAEADLRQSERKFRSVIEQSPDAIALTDHTGQIIDWNRAAEEIFGLAKSQVLDRKVWNVQFEISVVAQSNPERYESIKAGVLSLLQTGQGTQVDRLAEVLIRRPDGEQRIIQTTAFLVKNEPGYWLGSISRDVTERSRAEQALRENELTFRSLVEKSADALILTDESGRLVEWNAAAEQLFGLSRASALGWLLWDQLFRILPPERQIPEFYEQLKAGWQTYFQTGQHPSVNSITEVEIQRPDGSRRQVESARFSLPTARGFVLGAVIRDVTAQKQAEAERERLIDELQTSLAKVKQLSGLLPICASCKKIRNDQGYWQQVEVYIRDHSEADFSHSICPDCMEKLYPQYFTQQ
ncbi:MAG TPA: PAS domain S-box protein [Anaerolineae bacterium]|nr:PAS domain S-box protein [Anaerolineae bacterium]HMR65748.1 PAS domain S-box protein [Anaerolineae bacterium]